MKRFFGFLCIVLCLIGFCSCAKQSEQEAQIPATLEESVPNAYVGDIVIDDKQDMSSALEISIREKTFYVNSHKFSFDEFKNTQKVHTNLGDDVLSVYVREGVFEKCTVSSDMGALVRTYDSKGRCIQVLKTTRDNYGNITSSATYGEDGALQSFYTASYEAQECRITQRRDFNGSYDLLRVTEYFYSKNGKLLKEAVYGADLKLIEVKEANN